MVEACSLKKRRVVQINTVVILGLNINNVRKKVRPRVMVGLVQLT